MMSTLIKCPGCGANLDIEALDNIPYPAVDMMKKLRKYQPKSISFCRNCSLGVAVPLLSDDEIDSIYKGGDYWEKYQKHIIVPKHNPGHFALAIARWEYIKKDLKVKLSGRGISVLDIGGGHGFLGEAILKDGQQLKRYCIVEKDDLFRESLVYTWDRRYPGVQLQVCESLAEAEGHFDLIVFSHVLEHVNDPKGFINMASRFLVNDGVVFVDVPHQDFKFKKNVFPHVLFFNIQSLMVMSRSLGFTIIKASCFGRNPSEMPCWKDPCAWIMRGIDKTIYALRRVLPMVWLESYYRWFYQTEKENDQGVWLRILIKQ